MTILVTGANGFVGKSLCQALTLRSYNVRGSVRHECDDLAGHQVVVGDIGPDTDWNKALVDVDCVIHCAARVHILNETVSDPYSKFYEVNVAGTLHLAQQAHENGVKRLIYLSSIKVNGEETIDAPFTEMDTPCPTDDYGRSKYEAEQGLLALSKECGMEVVIVRPPLIYGPGVKANFLKLLGLVGKRIPLPFGSLHNKRSLIYLDNLLDLLKVCVSHPKAAGDIFLVSDGDDYTFSYLFRQIATTMGHSPFLLLCPSVVLSLGARLMGRGSDAQRLCGSLQVDISKAKELLDWTPPYSVDEGLRNTVTWFLGK